MATSGGLKRNADALDQELAKINLKKVAPYDPRTEQAPLSVLLSKEWKVLEDGRNSIAKLITEPFTTSEYSTELTRDLVKRVERDLLNQKGEAVVVCISGNMGGGKSTTLNSLFQVGNIAREGDSGGSCTLASNSFAKARVGQTSPFVAEVCFFGANERREILAGYLRDYYRALHGTGEEEGVAGEDNSSSTIRDEVLDVFMALFAKHTECRTKNDVRMFLQDADSEDDPNILTKLYGWSEKLVRKATSKAAGKSTVSDNKDKTVLLEASTPGELLTKLDVFAIEVDAADGESGTALWPFVSLVRFFFDDPLTKLGIVFLDTPGLTDNNRARRRSARQHSHKKTHSIIVSDASRAKDDSSIAIEAKFMSARGPDRCIIVLTKSDIIGETTVPPGSRKAKGKVEELRQKHADLERSLEQLEKQIDKCEEDGDDDQLTELNKQKRKLDVVVKYAENKRNAHCIQMRAESTTEKLQEKLQDVAQVTRPVPIYSISNKCYQQHLLGFQPKQAPALSVEDTNVPDLRRKLATLPNEARLNEAKHMQYTLLPGLLMRFSLYAARTPMERKSEMDKYVHRPLSEYDGIITACFNQFASALRERIVTPLQSEESSWIESARTLCVKWADNNKTGPFLALMNRDGHRKASKKNASLNMSGELVGLRAQKVSTLFSRAVQLNNDFENTVKEELHDLAGEIITSLKADPNYGFIYLEKFIGYINNEKDRIRHAVHQTSIRILEGLELVQRRATMSDEDSYIAEAMAPVYKAVAQLKHVKGQAKPKPKEGWPQHRKDTLKQEVTRISGIWSAVHTKVDADIKDFLAREKDVLNDQVGAVFRDFQEGFDSMCETKATMDPEEKKLQDQLKANLLEAEQLLEGPMLDAFEVLWRDYH